MKTSLKSSFIKNKWLLFLGLCCISFTAASQSSLYEYGNAQYLRLELNKPVFENAEDVGFFTLSNFLNAQIRVADGLGITVELPFAVSNIDDESDGGIGNIGIGLNYFAPNGKLKASFEIGLPTASDESEAVFLGIFGDLTERYGAFDAYSTPLSLYLNYGGVPSEGFLYRIRGGFDLAIATEDFVDTELYLGLNALVGYGFSRGSVQGGFSTLSILTEEDLDFSERVLEYFVLSGEFQAGNVRPGVVLRIPLDEEISDLLNVSVGLSIAVMLGE